MTLASALYGPGQERRDQFHLNNLSFAGPVIMGIGGKCYSSVVILNSVVEVILTFNVDISTIKDDNVMFYFSTNKTWL